MKKRIIATILAASMLVSLTGCGESSSEISELNSISALNSESSVSSSYSLSYSDEQEMIYAQVSDRQLLDLSALATCSDNEVQQVVNYMNTIDNQLVGKVNVASYADDSTKFVASDLVEDDAVVDAKITDYILTFMEQTPYYWQRTKTTIRGIDSSTRSIVVDVKYQTIDFEKTVEPDSTITLGDPNYDQLSESRYNKWYQILSLRYNNPSSAELPILESSFLEYWGDPDEIIASQRLYEPTAAIYQTGNQKTYSGLIDSEAEQTTGTMIVRYILVPDYVLGINLGVTCKHAYITEFSLDSDITEGLEAFTKEGYATVTDSVYNLIYSYFTCLDESDYNGLYKLTTNFETLDKYYEDVFNSTYQKHNGYSVSLFDITGTHITCGVTISTKERAKESNMTYPVYTDRYYMELELVDDTLMVSNMVLLSRKLEGEPAIDEDEVDTAGFSAIIDLDNDDKVAIENLICNFSALQLNADTTSDDFSSIVDTSISTNQLSSLKTNMTSLSGVKKVVFLQTYQQGTSNYASVKCKELYQDSTNAIVEAIAIYEFILKGGAWYIYNYDVNSSVKLDTTNLTTTGSLCLVTPGKVEAYTSQIKSSVSTNLDEVSDISVSFDHEEYTPTLKEAVVEQGLVLYTRSDIDEDTFYSVAKIAGLSTSDKTEFESSFDEYAEIAVATDPEELMTDTLGIIYDAMAVYLNIKDSRYSDEVAQNEAIETQNEILAQAVRELTSLQSSTSVDAEKQFYASLASDIQSINILIK